MSMRACVHTCVLCAQACLARARACFLHVFLGFFSWPSASSSARASYRASIRRARRQYGVQSRCGEIRIATMMCVPRCGRARFMYTARLTGA